jgi:hypothetical protein
MPPSRRRAARAEVAFWKVQTCGLLPRQLAPAVLQVKRLWVFPSEDGVSLPDNAPAVVAKVGAWR